MSKVKYVYEEEYACDCLDYLRKMDATRDYSSLLAVVERLQHHVNRMEAGIGKRWQVNSILENDNLSNTKKLKKISKLFDKGDK